MPSSRNGVSVSANVLGLSNRSVWLGSPDGRKPLVRLDRASLDASIVHEVAPEHYVSAIAGDANGAWVAHSRKRYEGDTYTTSRPA